MVSIPVPMLISAFFWYWAMRQPERPVRALERQSPTVVVKAVLMEEERTMPGLSPVARMARPSRVPRKRESSAPITPAAKRAVRSLYWPARGVSPKSPRRRVKTVSVLLRLTEEAPPMMAMFTE